MPSVLLLHPFDAIAGSQRVVLNIAQALCNGGCSVDVRLGFGSNGFVSTWSGVRRFLDINNNTLRKILYPFWLIAIFPRVLRGVFNGEVIWANTIHAAPAVFAALIFVPHRVIIHVHEVNFPRLFMCFLRFAGRRGATLLCVSDFHKQLLKLDAQVLFNCVPFEVDHELSSGRTSLVYVGNTSPEKGFSLFIEVAKRLKSSVLISVAFLPSISRCDPSLVKAARIAGITVNFGVTDPEEMYRNGYLSLLCSDPTLCTETFSLVAVESMSCLVPVASAGSCVLKEILRDAQVFDVPDRDPDRIVSEINELLSNQFRYEAFVQACRTQRAEYSFDRFRQNVQRLVNYVATEV